MSKLRVLELFGGIGACSKALERLGIDYEIADYVEIDKYAVASYNAINGTNFEPQDICEWDKDIEVDLIMHGSPCQDFSLAGKQAGGDEGSGTRSSLMYETIRIVDKLKPKYVIWENVKNLLSKKHRHNFDAYLEIMEQLGYKNYYQVLNAKDYGIPQNRERVFTISILGNKNYEFPNKQDETNLQVFLEQNVNIKTKPMCDKAFQKEYQEIITSDKDIYQCNVKSGYQDCKVGIKVSPTIRANNNCTHVLQRFEFPQKQELKLKLKDMLENEVDEKYYLSDRMINYIVANNEKWTGNNDKSLINKSIASAINTGEGSRRCDASNYVSDEVGENYNLKQDVVYKIRKLTPKECWRLMGFDDKDFDKAIKVNSNTQLYKQAGNSIVVNVLEAILTNLLLEPVTTSQETIEGQTTIFDYIGDSNSDEVYICNYDNVPRET